MSHLGSCQEYRQLPIVITVMATTEELIAFARSLYGHGTPDDGVQESPAVEKAKQDAILQSIEVLKHDEATANEPVIESAEDDVLGEYFIVHHPGEDPDKVKEFYVDLDFEDLHTNYGIINPLLPKEGTGRMTFIDDNARGVITTALTDADGNLLSQAQISGQKFRVFADGLNVEIDMDKYIREHRCDFKEFCNQSIRDQIEEIKERTLSISSGHGIPNLSDKACVFFEQNYDAAMGLGEQHHNQLGR